jgi:hypothetical protein
VNLISLFGIPRKACIHGLKLGSSLDKKKKKRPEVTWFKVVWFPLAIPRHAFMLSLVFRGALVTKEISVVGDLVETLYAVYAIALRKMLSICSSNLVSAVEYGGMYDKT